MGEEMDVVAGAIRVPIRENTDHTFGGDFPVVENYAHIAVDFYEGDSDPLHVTLKIAEVGRISRNGLLYDEDLVSAIERYLPEADGLRGHLTEDEVGKFPVADVFWLGHTRNGKELWAKGYIPPGASREDIKRRKRSGRKIGTSIYGTGFAEPVDENGTFRLRGFELETLDLLRHSSASLQNGGQFKLTRESAETPIVNENMEGEMPEITLADVPQTLREQIIREAQVQHDAGRVKELEQKLEAAEKTVKEAREYSVVVGSLRTILGENVDVVAVVSEMQKGLTQLREKFNVGADVNIFVTVEEFYSRMTEVQAREFAGRVEKAVEAITPFKVNDPQNVKRLGALRESAKKAAMTKLKGDETPEQVAIVVKQAYESPEIQIVAEMLRDLAGGPAAFVAGKDTREQGLSPADRYLSEEGQKALAEKFGGSVRK
jgi:hypothetical protein